MSVIIRKPMAGHLLLSEPFLRDFYFQRSVVLLAAHNNEGSFGLILNKPTSIKLSEVTDTDFDLDDESDSTVYLGGPVKTDSIFFIHTRPDIIGNGMKICDGIYWGGDLETVSNLLADKLILPSEIRFYLGYSGWDPQQLDNELDEKSWIVLKAAAREFMTGNPSGLWKSLLSKLGREYSDWINYPADPQLN